MKCVFPQKALKVEQILQFCISNCKQLLLPEIADLITISFSVNLKDGIDKTTRNNSLNVIKGI